MPDKQTGLALSIKQPWAWLIANGYKPVENRSWPTKVRGWVGIHAGQKFDEFGYELVQAAFPQIHLPEPHDLQRGAIVGRGRLVDCVTEFDSPWFFGPYGFVFDAAEPVPYKPCRGMLGFFTPVFIDP